MSRRHGGEGNQLESHDYNDTKGHARPKPIVIQIGTVVLIAKPENSIGVVRVRCRLYLCILCFPICCALKSEHKQSQKQKLFCIVS